ncbi:DUF2267 domain-containing protein [Bosea sp. (in: a-proteobacteria)]|jgi:uncharacterized protein (DUF2267 family)|uniref:DUF2267 domain-containing protein n=1 Tax=Bosea sp. (in: a-proteobacteria) TaxID=1871050 RepID=UPI003F71E12A
MTVPPEFVHASRDFDRFLLDARETLGHATTHQTWYSVLGVFVTFRARLSVPQAVAFAQALPPLLGAMFLFEWDPTQEPRPFTPRAELAREAKAFRIEHSFLPDSAIEDVAAALRRHVDRREFERLLAELPPEAQAFWAVAE